MVMIAVRVQVKMRRCEDVIEKEMEMEMDCLWKRVVEWYEEKGELMKGQVERLNHRRDQSPR